jgi:hypothetical protein
MHEDRMKYTIPQVELAEPQRIWLNEIYRRYRSKEDLDIREVKFALRGKLPPRFNPYDIDNRLIGVTDLTLLGILYADPKSDIIDKADRVIRAIRSVIENDRKVREVSCVTISEHSGLSEEEAAEVLRLICRSGQQYGQLGYRRKQDGGSECTVNVDYGSAFDEYMEYTDLHPFIQALYDRYASTPRNMGSPPIDGRATSDETEGVVRGTAFILMRIDPKNPDLEDILNAIKDACKSFDIKASRADEIEHQERITDVVLQEIRRAEFIIADLTYERPNVYYEVGYAHAIGKHPVLIQKTGTMAHFDIAAYKIREYQNATQLKAKLHGTLTELTSRRPKDLI